MSIKLKELLPPRDGMQKIPVYKDGCIAVFGERMIFQSPAMLRKGLLECWLWSDPKNRGDEDVELISIIRMSPGLDLEIRKNESPMVTFWSSPRFRRTGKDWNAGKLMITLPSILQTTTRRLNW